MNSVTIKAIGRRLFQQFFRVRDLKVDLTIRFRASEGFDDNKSAHLATYLTGHTHRINSFCERGVRDFVPISWMAFQVPRYSNLTTLLIQRNFTGAWELPRLKTLYLDPENF